MGQVVAAAMSASCVASSAVFLRVNSSLTRIGWLALCLILGGPCAFLALETVGLPFAAVALVLVVLIGKRRHLLANEQDSLAHCQ